MDVEVRFELRDEASNPIRGTRRFDFVYQAIHFILSQSIEQNRDGAYTVFEGMHIVFHCNGSQLANAFNIYASKMVAPSEPGTQDAPVTKEKREILDEARRVGELAAELAGVTLDNSEQDKLAQAIVARSLSKVREIEKLPNTASL